MSLWQHCPSCGRYLAPFNDVFVAIKEDKINKFLMNSPIYRNADPAKISITPDNMPDFHEEFNALGIPKEYTCCRMRLFTLKRTDLEFAVAMRK
jgi:hypothetical protein